MYSEETIARTVSPSSAGCFATTLVSLPSTSTRMRSTEADLAVLYARHVENNLLTDPQLFSLHFTRKHIDGGGSQELRDKEIHRIVIDFLRPAHLLLDARAHQND